MQPRLRDKIALAVALGFVLLAPIGYAGLYIRAGGQVLTVLVVGAVFVIFIIVTLWRGHRKFVSAYIGPNSWVCPRCGGTLRRGPLNGPTSIIMIDPAPTAWPDESLRSRFGYVWGCGKCTWSDQKE